MPQLWVFRHHPGLPNHSGCPPERTYRGWWCVMTISVRETLERIDAKILLAVDGNDGCANINSLLFSLYGIDVLMPVKADSWDTWGPEAAALALAVHRLKTGGLVAYTAFYGDVLIKLTDAGRDLIRSVDITVNAGHPGAVMGV